ncbi:MAG: hypothetical protein ABSB99_10520 [Acidimicrobiales bacterium]
MLVLAVVVVALVFIGLGLGPGLLVVAGAFVTRRTWGRRWLTRLRGSAMG